MRSDPLSPPGDCRTASSRASALSRTRRSDDASATMTVGIVAWKSTTRSVPSAARTNTSACSSARIASISGAVASVHTLARKARASSAIGPENSA